MQPSSHEITGTTIRSACGTSWKVDNLDDHSHVRSQVWATLWMSTTRPNIRSYPASKDQIDPCPVEIRFFGLGAHPGHVSRARISGASASSTTLDACGRAHPSTADRDDRHCDRCANRGDLPILFGYPGRPPVAGRCLRAVRHRAPVCPCLSNLLRCVVDDIY